MGSAERDHSSCEALNLVVLPYQTPVKPAHFVILAVRVIVSVLTSAKLIATQQHWNASRDKKGQQEILDQAVPHSLDSCIIACSFHPAIVAIISIGSIAVVLAIFVIVLLLVADQVVQCEAVMTSNEVQAASGALAGALVQI